MIEIIAGTEEELAALRSLQETGLPEVFWEHGYMLRIRCDGRLQTVGGGGRNVIVHYVGAEGTGSSGCGGGGGSTAGNAAITDGGGGG